MANVLLVEVPLTDRQEIVDLALRLPSATQLVQGDRLGGIAEASLLITAVTPGVVAVLREWIRYRAQRVASTSVTLTKRKFTASGFDPTQYDAMLTALENMAHGLESESEGEDEIPGPGSGD